MNYFRCTVGGSGGKFKLTVTCDSGFAGATISCTDGTTTLTATCPSSSPYTVIFKIPNGGTWTVSSGINSTTVVIPDTATLHQIPTGSTATPVNVIQTWLHCADIWNKNYTTINQVLADTSTLLALISSNNAADYMARSTNWTSSVCANQTAMGYIGNNNYCANKLLANSTWLNAICNSTYMESVLNVKVPTMTSNTTPYGLCFGGTLSAGNYYNPFDGVLGDPVWVSTTINGNYCGYKATSPICVKCFKVTNRTVTINRTIRSCKLQGSNNTTNGTNGTWVDIGSYTLEKAIENACEVSNDTPYLAHRLLIISNYGDQFVEIDSLQFYGRS